MSQKTAAQIISDANLYLPDNTTEELSAQDQRDRVIDLADSSLNKTDGGVVATFISYLTNLTFTDDKHLVAKKYVDDLITALNAITQGTNILTENFNIYTDDNDLLIQSGEEGGTDPRSQFGLSASAASLSYLDGDVVNSVNVDNLSVNLSHADAGNPSNDSAIGCVDGKVSVVGDFSIADGNFTYYKGDESTDGSIRIGMVGTELVAQRRAAGVWTTENTIIS